VLGAMLVSLVVAEVAVRILTPTPKPRRFVVSPDPELIYALNPDYPGINRRGMRGPEIVPEDLKNRYVVAVVGDSHTFAVEVHEAGQPFPDRMQHYLEAADPDRRARVLNFGVPGYNLAQYLAVVKKRVLTLEVTPSLLVLQSTINDTHVCNYLHPDHPTLSRWMHESALFELVWRRIFYSRFGRDHLLVPVAKRFPDALLFHPGLVGTLNADADPEPAHRGHPTRDPALVPERYHYMLGPENWTKHVREMAELCDARGIPKLATGFLSPDQRRVVEEAGFSVLTFDDIFEGRDMRDYGYNPKMTSDHFNVKGNDAIGKALAEWVIGHGWFGAGPVAAQAPSSP
jgi:lysophospholipase L1-like esterase